MAGQIVFNGININNIISEIKITKNQNHHTSDYVGQNGSMTSFISSGGKVLSFKNIVKHDEQSPHGRGHRINDYKYLAENFNKTDKVLTSPSKSNINGKYIITKFDYTEDTGHNFIIEWEMVEVVKFNVKAKTFRVWGKAINSKNKKKTTKTSKNGLNTNTKYLLKTCPTMKKGHSGKKCVKALQKFLQSKGYYTKYKIDGIYGIYTEQAVKSLQKKFKLKSTGKWDKSTRNYFQKKYKYPTSQKTSGVTGRLVYKTSGVTGSVKR